MNSIPTTWRHCATCSRWSGRATPNAFCTNVEFDPHETGKCMGGGYNLCNTPPMGSCNKWQQRW